MTTTNNAINVSPTPDPGWTPIEVITGPSNNVYMDASHLYITGESTEDRLPIFTTRPGAAIRVGDQYRIISYLSTLLIVAVGFTVNATGSQTLFYQGASGVTVTCVQFDSTATAITITCIGALPGAEDFLIELGTGQITLIP